MKDSFILYNSFYEPIKTLKNEQLGKLLRAIFDYTINDTITQDDEILVPFMFIKNQIDIDTKKWEDEKSKRSEAGKKGMQNRWHNKDNNVITVNNKNNSVINAITKITDNVNVNVNENDNVNVNDIYNYIEQNFCRTLNPLEYEEISKWKDDELTRYAIKEAILGGKYNIKYISAILHNYKMNNIKTVQQAKEQKSKFKNKGEPIPSWFNKEIEKEEATKEEQDEIERLLGEFK